MNGRYGIYFECPECGNEQGKTGHRSGGLAGPERASDRNGLGVDGVARRRGPRRWTGSRTARGITSPWCESGGDRAGSTGAPNALLAGRPRALVPAGTRREGAERALPVAGLQDQHPVVGGPFLEHGSFPEA